MESRLSIRARQTTDAERALFASLAHIPRAVLRRYRVRLPAHIDQADLLAAANEALVQTIRTHSKKPPAYLARLAWIRCAGALRDELRSFGMIQGARRGHHTARGQLVPLALVSETALRAPDSTPPMLLGSLVNAVNALPPRWRRVVLARAMGIPATEIARELGVSDPRVSQIYALAIRRLRAVLIPPP